MASSIDSRWLPKAPAVLGSAIASVILVGSLRAEGTPCNVDWQHGLLTVRTEGASRVACIEALARKTGLKVSGLENLRGTVSADLSTRFVREVVRQVAGDVSFTLVENDADHAGDPRTQSLRFFGTGTTSNGKAPLSVLWRQTTPFIMVENVDSGVMEAQPAPAQPDPKASHAHPVQAGNTAAQVHLED